MTPTCKLEMISAATRELRAAVRENYYSAKDLKTLNYSEITEWLGWPDLQDGGLYEQAITIAADNLLWAMGEI